MCACGNSVLGESMQCAPGAVQGLPCTLPVIFTGFMLVIRFINFGAHGPRSAIDHSHVGYVPQGAFPGQSSLQELSASDAIIAISVIYSQVVDLGRHHGRRAERICESYLARRAVRGRLA